uniref:Interferon regulatory factor 5 n=1 Tax=Poecilia formosa TaxID=48698 RepID=A0A087Y6D1_POEFO
QSSQCSTMSIHPRRIRLKPWLLAQVNSGRYPGLQWLGSEQRLFQIPWKHATRHTPMSEEENTIFKAWAVETGKYQEGVDEPDPAKWKANLRCALNKSREFRLRFDGTKETPLRPYKIYEVCDGTGAAGEPTGPVPFQSSNGAEDEDEEVRIRTVMPDLTDLSIKPRIEPASFPPFGSAQVIPMPLLPLTSELQPRGSMADPEPEPTVLHSARMHGGQQHGVRPEPVGPSEPAVLQPAAQMVLPLITIAPELLKITDLDLKFWYRGRAMGSLTVSNPQGCRLYYGHLEPTPEQVDLFGPVSLQQVLFPGTAEIQNQKQRFYTDALLDVMDRGLILEIQQQDIYAIRLCQCKVFWSGPGIPELGPPNPMERERRIRVFSLNDFLQGLILFQKGEAANPPPFDVFFCFGEDWPDRKPKEKKLIMVQVVPVVARILTEMFSGELAWSTDSIRLQISNPDVKDQTVEQFKELQRLLQNQLGPTGPWAPAGSLEAPTGFSMGTS